MLIRDKLKKMENYSQNEQVVAQYLLDLNEDLRTLSTNDIAKRTYTSSSTVIRLAQKMGFTGWGQLKEALCTEQDYLNKENHDIDASFPFTRDDSIQKITERIKKLDVDTLEETAQLIHHDDLQKAVISLYNANRIYIFAMGNSAAVCFDFQYKMKYLFKDVQIINNRDDFAYTFQIMNEKSCCLFISYSGETFEDLHLSKVIKSCKFPCISITAYKENSLIQCTPIHFFVPDKEDRYSKIGHFSSNEGIHFILDLLYACTFNHNYENSITKRKNYIEQTDYPNKMK